MLKFIQLCAASWEGNREGNLTFTLFGLTADGAVYRLTHNGWIAEIMEVTTKPVGKPRYDKPQTQDPKDSGEISRKEPFGN